MKRRTFLIGSAVAAGGLAVGYRMWSGSFEARAAALVAGKGESLLAGWIKIAADDTVTVYIPHVDMGQGSHTALAMMAADELDAAWPRVRTARAPGDKAFANRFLARGWIMQGLSVPSFLSGTVDMGFAEAARFINLQITGGSTAVRFTGQAGLRIVGAAARVMLLRAAARRWDVPVAELRTADSVVSHDRSSRRARYGELAAEAAGLSVPSTPTLKSAKDFRIIGRSVPRLDIPGKVTGETVYGIDLRLPDMRYAAVMAAPVHGGTLTSVDPAPALRIKGVERVLPFKDYVAVVARGYWSARKGLAALKPVFSDGGNGAASSATLQAQHERVFDAGDARSLHERGDAAQALSGRHVEATYHVPFLHQAPLEPIAGTARFRDGKLTVWAGEQDALGSTALLARLTGLDAADIDLVTMPVGGAFGRRSATSGHYLGQFAEIARAMAPFPVKTIWSREEEFAQGAYRPQVASRIRAALGADGRPTAWSQVFIHTDGINEAFSLPYAIASQSLRSVVSRTHVRTGSWRSVAHTQHGFYTECFIDELAHAAGRDPFEYRRDLLPQGSRERRVLELAARKSGWGQALPKGHGRGIALVASFGSVVAQVVEASLDAEGLPRVHRVVAAVDCGGVCHPDTAQQQIEGGILMGLGAAIGERITIERGMVQQVNFPDYPIMSMARTPPAIEVHFVASDAPWGGLGEPGVPPVAPALANALFAATGKRVRRLPVLKQAA
ncbi:MAG: xanthine dehydrogenase family protein molybdopterin-binding subunit [Alphaproteobacteria bacterium]|nr:xanthine dehydrogenase family protein molybdopterin-binding subunit [Alphaproteobacteria bacterium]MCW5739882.1 xanthine dehydrogenase family protein molybdopterin-binding subunit [Alphaproteobacteria bacterium]